MIFNYCQKREILEHQPIFQKSWLVLGNWFCRTIYQQLFGGIPTNFDEMKQINLFLSDFGPQFVFYVRKDKSKNVSVLSVQNLKKKILLTTQFICKCHPLLDLIQLSSLLQIGMSHTYQNIYYSYFTIKTSRSTYIIICILGKIFDNKF